MNFNVIFTKKQFLRYYMNIGSNVSNLNRINSYFIIGLNNNLSIIHFDRIIFKLKKKLNFVFKFSKKVKNLNFLCINTNINEILSKKFAEKCLNIRCSYFNGRWWNGFLKSFKKYIRYKNSKNSKKFYIFMNQYPKFVLYLDRQKYGDLNFSVVNIQKELSSICMNNIMFINDSFDFFKNCSSLLVNTKSYINNLFLFYIFVRIVSKCIFIHKKFFFCKIFQSYKTIFFKNNKYFYDYTFCLKNKKNFKKNHIWSDDLK